MFMKKALIFGSGSTGKRVYEEIKNEVHVLGFLDNDKSRWSMKICNLPVFGNAEAVKGLNYDEIWLASFNGYMDMHDQLIAVGVGADKLRADFCETTVKARINFLRDFANMNQHKILNGAAVAEGGVFQGEFAKEINACFPNQKLYLFDTFEGFDKRDVDKEEDVTMEGLRVNHLNDTSVDLVLSKLSNPENAIIRKGFFPETAQGLEDTKYFFVNLDFDLYQPILEGLRFFMPRLQVGGVC